MMKMVKYSDKDIFSAVGGNIAMLLNPYLSRRAYPKVVGRKLLASRKSHRCTSCRAPILAKEKTLAVKILFKHSGKFKTFYYCMDCRDLIPRYFHYLAMHLIDNNINDVIMSFDDYQRAIELTGRPKDLLPEDYMAY